MFVATGLKLRCYLQVDTPVDFRKSIIRLGLNVGKRSLHDGLELPISATSQVWRQRPLHALYMFTNIDKTFNDHSQESEIFHLHYGQYYRSIQCGFYASSEPITG
jgi:hypothetical protein